MPSGHLPVTRNVNSFDVLMNYDNVVNFDTEIHAERRQILQWHPLEPITAKAPRWANRPIWRGKLGTGNQRVQDMERYRR